MKKLGPTLLAITVAVSLMSWAAPGASPKEFEISIKPASILSAADELVLNPIADSYIDSDSPSDNFGGSGYLDVRSAIYDSGYFENEYEVSYLKFDLSSIPQGSTINSAELQLYAWYTSDVTAHVGAHYCQDNTWSEIGITWSNAPGYVAKATDIVDIAFDDEWYSWDVTGDVQKGLSNGALTEVVKSERTASGYESVSFRSKDTYREDEVPRLVISISENNPPNLPTNPSPANHATEVAIDVDLSWTGGDPNVGDTVTYNVYFGTSDTPPLVSEGQTGMTYDPGTLQNYATYYWKIIAKDNHAASTTGPLWDFTTFSAPGPNQAPNTPTNPFPENGATVFTPVTLSVLVSDPDGDAMNVTFYDASDGSVIDTDTSVASGGRAEVTWSGLVTHPTYSWCVIACDSEPLCTTSGTWWTFTAGEEWDLWVYDENHDGKIQKNEAIKAVQDYFDGKISKAQAIEVVMLYFG